MVVMGSGTGARMLALVDLLESGGLRGRTELARLLGVDERTVRRDVVRLLDAGVPVESVRGRYGGYRLGRGYRLPPLMLTDDEAVAVLVALADASDRTGDVPAATAAAKVRRVLPAASAARLEGLVEAAVVPGDVTAVDADVLLTVAGAVREHRPIEIAHRRRGDPAGEPAARRVVHPYGLVRRDGRWYLLGLALDRGVERTFRLDRVERARTLAGRFRPPPGYDPVVRLEALQGTGYRYAVRVRVRATEAEVRRFLPASVARVRPAGPPADGAWLRVELGADHLDWLPGVLAALDRPFVVDEPDELVTRLRELADRLAARVNAASPDVGS